MQGVTARLSLLKILSNKKYFLRLIDQMYDDTSRVYKSLQEKKKT